MGPEPSRDRFRGALLGLACGDALGTTLEFSTPGSFARHTDMTGGGPFRLAAGQWTDDTSMALCLAESLLECQGFDPRDQIERYDRWFRTGHLSATGRCFDIGNTIRAALLEHERSGKAFCGSPAATAAGNGSIMRLAPVPMAFANEAELAIRLSAESSRTTHRARTCVDACRFLGALLVAALAGVPKEELLRPRFSPIAGLWEREPLVQEIDEVAVGSWRARSPPEIKGTGYVVRSLEAALWAFGTTATFREGAIAAVNLGDDADTTGAVYGQLAGATYGAASMPQEWVEKLAQGQPLVRFADGLAGLSQLIPKPPRPEGLAQRVLGWFKRRGPSQP